MHVGLGNGSGKVNLGPSSDRRTTVVGPSAHGRRGLRLSSYPDSFHQFLPLFSDLQKTSHSSQDRDKSRNAEECWNTQGHPIALIVQISDINHGMQRKPPTFQTWVRRCGEGTAAWPVGSWLGHSIWRKRELTETRCPGDPVEIKTAIKWGSRTLLCRQHWILSCRLETVPDWCLRLWVILGVFMRLKGRAWQKHKACWAFRINMDFLLPGMWLCFKLSNQGKPWVRIWKFHFCPVWSFQILGFGAGSSESPKLSPLPCGENEGKTQVENTDQDFPGSPVVKTLPSNAGGAGSIPGQGDKTPHVLRPKHQNRKQKLYCDKFNKNF